MNPLEIKLIHCADAPGLTYTGDSCSFSLPIEVTIGSQGETAGDIFSIIAVSADRLAQGGNAQAAKLVLPEWDAQVVRAFLQVLVNRAAQEETPSATQAFLRRWFDWEFEGMDAPSHNCPK